MTTQLTNRDTDHGLLAVIALMAANALLPAGGELVTLFAGALAAGAAPGHTGPGLGVAAAVGTLAYLAGSLAGRGIGRTGGHAFGADRRLVAVV